jgi:putative membrane protein
VTGYGPYGHHGPHAGYGPPAGPYGAGPRYGPPAYGVRPPVRFAQGVHRLHWATAPLRALTILVIYFVLVGFSLLLTPSTTGIALDLTPEVITRFALVSFPVSVLAVLVGFWAWWSVRFWIAGDELVVETGILFRRKQLIPLSHIQAIDVVRPFVTRALNLAEMRVELAGGDQGEIVLRFLGRPAAQQLRAELLARAAGLPGHTPEAPERPLWRVRFGTLFGSLILKVPVVGGLLFFSAVLVLGTATGEPGVLGAAVPVLLGLLRAVVAPLIMYGGFHAAMSPDGLRLRYGLLETRMQTVPPGRVQAIRIVEPSMWRSNAWARVDVTVAGYVGERQALSSVLLPVAPRHVAFQLVAEVFPGSDVEAVRLLPASGKSWSLDRDAAAGTDDVVFVTRRGVFSRSTDVIGHARAQSVRLTAGPLQRLRGLGTVHIDAPPGPVQVAAVDRDLREARLIVESTAERARVARARPAIPGPWVR